MRQKKTQKRRRFKKQRGGEGFFGNLIPSTGWMGSLFGKPAETQPAGQMAEGQPMVGQQMVTEGPQPMAVQPMQPLTQGGRRRRRRRTKSLRI